MKIVIEYSSSWDVKLLENNISKSSINKYRKIIKKNAKSNGVTFNTILGILYRLVGDQRKVWHILERNNYLGLTEQNIRFKTYNVKKTKESIALRDISGVFNPASTIGLAKKESHPVFKDKNICGMMMFPFYCEPIELYDLIVNSKFGNVRPFDMKSRISIIKIFDKLKSEIDLEIKNNNNLTKMEIKNGVQITQKEVNGLSLKQRLDIMSVLRNKFPDVNYFSSREADISKYYIFCLSAMYICYDEIVKKYPYVSNFDKNNKDKKWAKGISKRNITDKDLVGSITGGKNTTINYPMMIDTSSGFLEITIDTDEESAIQLKEMIEYANVGCFQVGKKGLAFVKQINTRRTI